jgi:glyoxylase-like metal-dependent hydrolase (beta-lactamase superfamily II)
VAAFLVNTGKQLILVDTGAGGFWGGKAFGHLAQNLRASGYRPEQVDIVLLTHLHADHVAGLRNADGKRKFPNATVSMLQADSDFWLSKEIASEAPPEAKEFFDLAQASAKPYQAAGKWKPIAPGEEIVPGVRSRPLAGHTPGHRSGPASPARYRPGVPSPRCGRCPVARAVVSRSIACGSAHRRTASAFPVAGTLAQ